MSNMLIALNEKLTYAEMERMKNSPPNAYLKPGAESHGLISLDYIENDKKLNNFFDLNFPHCTTRSYRRTISDTPYSTSAGREAGEKLNIYEPITGEKRGDGSIKGFLD
jgi:hypothetical protein